MNQSIKVIIFASILGLSPAIFAMDEQPKAQAELDAIQFAKEQESKKVSATANKQAKENQRKKIENGLKVALTDVQIKDKPFNSDLIEMLPADIQKEILKFAYSPTAFSHGYQLLPALIPCCPRDLCCFSFQGFDKADKKYKKKFHVNINITFIHPDPWKRRLQGLLPTGYTIQIRWSDSEISSRGVLDQTNNLIWWFDTYQPIPYENFEGMLANDKLYLPASLMREALESCSIEQLNLIRTLWVNYDERYRNATFIGNLRLYNDIMNQPIKLSAQESKLFESLPQQIRFNLESNYRIQTTRARYKKVALIGLGCAAVIGSVWKFSKQ